MGILRDSSSFGPYGRLADGKVPSLRRVSYCLLPVAYCLLPIASSRIFRQMTKYMVVKQAVEPTS